MSLRLLINGRLILRPSPTATTGSSRPTGRSASGPVRPPRSPSRSSALSFERDAGSGSYTITDKSSGKALTARALELNGPVTMEEPDGSAAQQWDVTANGDGTLRIQPASDHSLTADMCGAWSWGSRMLLWSCGRGENQRFVAVAEKR
ncbi:RICIN domain-containing protein [Collinsella sp. LCP21S3_C7]|uniref:RICIN domain-containing protein n=1 Tax=Collinsella sp. LCP21S3_C7 TaxID=3438772 RepID=UPI003F91B70B